MISTILFDMGGVIFTLGHERAIERFRSLGLADAPERLNAYTQAGIFGDLECGRINAETFRQELSKLCHRELTADECRWAWMGYCEELPQRNLDKLLDLRRQGYRLILLSNTNPFMMQWVMGPDFDGHGHPLSHYMDAAYESYKCGMMKPAKEFFRKVIDEQALIPAETLFVDDGPRNVAVGAELGFRTFCPANGSDWTGEIENVLRQYK